MYTVVMSDYVVCCSVVCETLVDVLYSARFISIHRQRHYTIFFKFSSLLSLTAIVVTSLDILRKDLP